MKTYYSLIFILLMGAFISCEDQILNISSLSEPVDETFYSNEQEMEMALAAVYSSIDMIDPSGYQVPMMMAFDNAASDIGVARLVGGNLNLLGTGTQSANTFSSIYAGYYTGIARANALLSSMEKAKDAVIPKRFDEIKGQALTIRAYHYMFLTELFGDVPYLDKVPKTPLEGAIPRTAKSAIVDHLLKDLSDAADVLPYKWEGDNEGRVSKGFALGLRARIALYNNRYDEAITSAKAIMENESTFGYRLHPDYQELFQMAGQNTTETILKLPSAQGYRTKAFTSVQGSRNLGGSTVTAPTQSLIDSYEAIDGKPIDESTVYDPKHPFENRDPRLKASIVTPQSTWAGLIFESHPDSLTVRTTAGTVYGNNNDSRGIIWAAAFCGYLWKKYTVEEVQVKKQAWDEIDFFLMRYAEVLLIYAEAKVMANQIDQTVLTAINRIRARAYGVDVTNTDSYPAITSQDKAELTKVIRRERKVELANEGFRLFDIRRWRIAEKVMPVPMYGRILDPSKATGIPQIDDDCFVSYAGVESQYDLNTDVRFVNAFRIFNPQRDYLCPVPQTEIDTYKRYGVVLTQNPEY